MAYDYATLTATTLRLIAKFGAPITLRAQGTVADPVTGLGAVAGVTRELQAIQIKSDEETFPDTRVLAGDMAFIIEGAAVNMSDKWVKGSAEWTIVSIIKIQPNGSDVLAVKILVRA